MSTVISYNKSETPTLLSDKIWIMSEHPNSELTDFLRRILADRGLNYREVAQKSGGLITHSTVYDILAGRSKNPTTLTLKGLAKGLGVPEEEVFRVARGGNPIENSVEEELLSYVRELSDIRKRDLLNMAKMFFLERRTTAEVVDLDNEITFSLMDSEPNVRPRQVTGRKQTTAVLKEKAK